MAIDEEIELIETTISYLESAINEILDSEYFSYKAETYREEIRELEEKLDELEAIQCKEWADELKELEHEYWQDQF